MSKHAAALETIKAYFVANSAPGNEDALMQICDDDIVAVYPAKTIRGKVSYEKYIHRQMGYLRKYLKHNEVSPVKIAIDTNAEEIFAIVSWELKITLAVLGQSGTRGYNQFKLRMKDDKALITEVVTEVTKETPFYVKWFGGKDDPV